MRCDTVWKDARLATMLGDGIGALDFGLIAAEAGKIVYAGLERSAPALDAAKVVQCEGRWITPGLIDPHTHLVYAGNRAVEFERRLSGLSYEQIAAAGGGILSSVRETRRATEADLIESALVRLDALMAEGITTIEIKSGYGLTLQDELKMLRAARMLGQKRAVRVVTTLLAAHAVPPEYAEDADGYIDLVCTHIIPAAAEEGLADAVDVFCESIAFTVAQTRRVFEAARAHGLPVKVHAEQRTNSGGAALASTFNALSADHLEHLDQAGVAALAASGTVATLLPGAFYFLRETQLPPVASLLAAGVPIALGTDSNPGTSPLTSILLTMNMAATLFRMTVHQCLRGVTCNAARALGLADACGTLEAGKACDLVIWDIENPAELVYRMGFIPPHQRIWSGR